MFSRRDFVKGGVALVTIGTSAQSLLKGTIAFAAQNPQYVEQASNGKILILVQLAGVVSLGKNILQETMDRTPSSRSVTPLTIRSGKRLGLPMSKRCRWAPDSALRHSSPGSKVSGTAASWLSSAASATPTRTTATSARLPSGRPATQT